MTLEFRVVWKREGLRRKAKRFARRATAERFMRLFGPEPWTGSISGKGPDEFYCCAGWECFCRGMTIRQHHDETRANLPLLEYGPALEHREVGLWVEP